MEAEVWVMRPRLRNVGAPARGGAQASEGALPAPALGLVASALGQETPSCPEPPGWGALSRRPWESSTVRVQRAWNPETHPRR